MEEQGTHAEGAPADGQRTTGGTLPELANLTEQMDKTELAATGQ